jgi:signal transduction histidine kinase
MLIFAKWAIAVALIVLALDDFWAWWEGRPSAFGAILDQMFGEGTSAKFRNWTKSLVQALSDGFKALGQLLLVGILGVIDMIAFLIQTGYTSIQRFTASVSEGISRTLQFVLELILKAQQAWSTFTGNSVDTSGLERMIELQKEAQNASKSDLSRAAKSLPLQKLREDLATGMSYGTDQFMKTAMGTKAISTADNRVQTVNVTVQGASDPTTTANRVGTTVKENLDLKSVAVGVPAG